MKLKLYLMLLVATFLLLLTGCSEMDEILSKVNQLLDGEETTENTDSDEPRTDEIDEVDASEESSEDEDATSEVTNEETSNDQEEADENGDDGADLVSGGIVDLRGIIENRPIGNVFLGPELPFESHFSNYEVFQLEHPDYLPFDHPDNWVLVDEIFDEVYGYEAVHLINSNNSLEEIIQNAVASDDYSYYEKMDHPEYNEFYMVERYKELPLEEFFGLYHFYVDDNGNKIVYVMLHNEDLYRISD